MRSVLNASINMRRVLNASINMRRVLNASLDKSQLDLLILGKVSTVIMDEACSSAKGANIVVSYIHHYFATYSLGERKLVLHADNCW